jgi:hypothetical protein
MMSAYRGEPDPHQRTDGHTQVAMQQDQGARDQVYRAVILGGSG